MIWMPTRAERIELEKALLAALKQCGISVRWALAGPSELFDVADVLLQSDWLAAERAKAWDEGFIERGNQEQLQRRDRFHAIERENPYREVQ